MNDRHGDQNALRLADAHLRRILPQKIVCRGQANAIECGADRLIALISRPGYVSAPSLFELSSNLECRIQR